MFTLSQESLLTVREAARRIPGRSGKPIHVSAVYRWIERGVQGVRLEAAQIGGTLYTSVEALQRFSDALTARRHGRAVPIPRSKRVKAAEAELERDGF